MNRSFSKAVLTTGFLVVLSPIAGAEIEQPGLAPLVEERLNVPVPPPVIQSPTAESRLSRIQGGPSSRASRLARLIPEPEGAPEAWYTATVRILACESKDRPRERLPKEVQEAMATKLITHAACGKLPAQELQNGTVEIAIGQSQTLNTQRPVSYLLNRAVLSTDGGVPRYTPTTQRHDVTSGIKTTLTLSAASADKLDVVLNVQELMVDTSREEQLMFDDGQVFFNPIPVVWERGLHAQGGVTAGKPEIMGGQAYVRKPADPEQEVMPETGRLWAEITLTPRPKTAAQPER